MKLSLDYIKRWLQASRKRYFDWGVFIALFFVTFWFIGNIISPFLIPAGTVNLGDDGVTGIVPTLEDNADQIDEIENNFARTFYKAGNGNCHQRASRSFFLNDNQMPFCARDVAIFFGLVVGVALLMFLVIELNILWFILGLVPMALDGGIQLITEYESTNLLRFLTGTLAGIVAGLALGYIISEVGVMMVSKKKLK